jgi:hypothetical protein
MKRRNRFGSQSGDGPSHADVYGEPPGSLAGTNAEHSYTAMGKEMGGFRGAKGASFHGKNRGGTHLGGMQGDHGPSTKRKIQAAGPSVGVGAPAPKFPGTGGVSLPMPSGAPRIGGRY